MISELMSLDRSIRYVAVYVDGDLQMASREGLDNASEGETDRYEELLVNPTLLTLGRQRGNIDCGGLHYLLVRYGNFFQFVRPVIGGHVSVAIEANAEVLAICSSISDWLDAREV